jgi:hypothetical protein
MFPLPAGSRRPSAIARAAAPSCRIDHEVRVKCSPFASSYALHPVLPQD